MITSHCFQALGLLKPSWLARAVVLMMLALLALPAGAQDLSLEGTVSYTISGTKVVLKADKVVNHSDGGTSGTLRLRLWATSSPYSGGSISGYVMGTSVLGVLEGGYQFPGVSMSVAFTGPPSGTYYITVTLEEYQASGAYTIVDYMNFSGTKQIGPGGSFGDIKLEGLVSWKQSGSKITLKADKVVNYRDSGTSGTLRLQIWATRTAYSGGRISGNVLGSVTLGTLKGGYYYPNINKTGTYRKPPNGTYYITMTLEESQRGSYVMQSYINMRGTSTFGSTTPPINPPGGVKKDWFTLTGGGKDPYAMLRSLGLDRGPVANPPRAPIYGRGVQLWSYCAAAMSYYDVYKSKPNDQNWTAHEETAKLAYAFYERAPWD